MNLLQGKFIGSCNTPKQIGHYTAPQWHIAACMSSIILYRWPQTSNRYHTTWPVQKLNSYILQSSCRGGMQRMIRSSNLILHTQRTYTWAINTLLYKYIQRWLPTYPKYTQRTTMYAPTHNTKSTQRTARSYMYIHNYIYMYSSIRDNNLWLKSVVSIPTAAKRNPTKKSHAMRHSTDVF